jgi:hypothetical protein
MRFVPFWEARTMLCRHQPVRAWVRRITQLGFSWVGRLARGRVAFHRLLIGRWALQSFRA